ncbi:MAG TPA: response regulator, partial [Planctomycetota bacterium]|nr:response regulator [Planctomycetota bacterium]
MKPRHRILIVDDESFVRDSLVDLLEAEGYATSAASGKDEALKILETEHVSVIVTDLRMPGGDGISLLQEARKKDVEAPVILLTGVGTVPEAVEAMRSGAHDFIQKPVESKEFVVLIRRAIEHLELVSEVKYLRTAVRGLQGPGEIVGSSRAMAAVRALAAQVAPADATVLIRGE